VGETATQKRKTWSQIAIENAGYRDALVAMEFAMNWGMCTVALDREPESIDEYADETGVSRATAFRHQQAFRRAFPMLEGPTELNRRARMMPAYEEIKTLALEPVQLKPFVLARVFMLGAVKADLRGLDGAV
jgi:hypothetical protein